MIIAIDPGKLTISYALGRAKYLYDVGYLKFPNLKDIGYWAAEHWDRYDVVVIEKPQIYQNTNRHIDQNDLVDLARTVGLCSLVGREVVEYLPREWKGQVPKTIHNRRIKKMLKPAEIDIVKDRGLYNNHNVLDSIGILLHYWNRGKSELHKDDGDRN
jgi:hypothetical protein